MLNKISKQLNSELKKKKIRAQPKSPYLIQLLNRKILNYQIKKISISTRQKNSYQPNSKIKIKIIKKLALNMTNKQINARARNKKIIVDVKSD